MNNLDYLESHALLEVDRMAASAAQYALDQISAKTFAEQIIATRIAVKELARHAKEKS